MSEDVKSQVESHNKPKQMNIVEHRKLGEALDSDDMGMNDPVVLAAARLTYDRYQECGECEDGKVALCSVHWKPHNDCLDYRISPCPRCGGSGLQPNQARLEAATDDVVEKVARAIFDYTYEGEQEWDDFAEGSLYLEEFRHEARAALAVVRAFDKETE